MIASLSKDLTPVRPFSALSGAMLVAAATALAVLAVAFVEGLWAGLWQGEAAPFYWVTTGLLLILGLASATAVIAMASPAVGSRHDAPKWASAMLAVLPLAAMVSLFAHDHGFAAAATDMYGVHCFTASLVASSLTGAALILWLRRGAPVTLNLAGWFTGLAAGALGTVAYGLSCSIDTIAHLGIWHVAPVVVAAIIGRLIVPALVKW